MLDLAYPASPLLGPRERSAGVRLPDVGLRGSGGQRVRLHDLVGNRPVLFEVTGERDPRQRQPRDLVRLNETVPGGEGGSTTRAPAGGRDAWHDPTGSLRSLLDGEDGWILVRPDTHVAWARGRPDGGRMDEAARRALGGPLPDGTG